jgi:hypothetical protein
MSSSVMRLRAGNHGASAAAKSFTVAVMVLATFAQFASLEHEMTVRHFRCAEHGELTHVAAISVSASLAGAPASRPSGDTLRARDAETADVHDHCAVAFTVEGSSCAPSIGGAVGVVQLPPPAIAAVPAAPRKGRAFVLASAPKTSPPSASA